MAQNFISPSYTFTPGAAGVGTLNLSGISGFSIKRLIAVVNVTRGVVIYSPVNPATNVASTTLTLGVDTSTHNAADNLIVKYESSQSDNLQVGGSDVAVGNPVPVSDATKGYTVAVTLTRTADTNVYAANDVLGAATGSTAALTFASMGPSGGNIMITSAELQIDASSVISGETSYRLYLYNVTPPSATGDNGAWDLPSGDRASFLGYIDLGSPVDLGSTLYVQTDGINKHIKLSSTDLFGYLVTTTSYTPTSARVHKITLHAVAL